MTVNTAEEANTGALWSWVTGVAASSSPVFSVVGKELIEGRCLGDGGFAYVHEARDRSSGEVFALRKVLCQDSERLSAAEAELALLRRLPANANIVRFYGGEFLKESSGTTLAVSIFEFCPGGTLLSRLQVAMTAAVESGTMNSAARCCPGCLPEADVLFVLEGVAKALAHMHSQVPLVVHYDVKSENILLGSDELWKLCDFGSASTKTFELAGAPRRLLLEVEEFIHGRITPIYRPPEVADVYLRWAIGPKVDIFALGCVLFATLTGVHPFPLESSLANIQANYKLPSEAANLYSAALPIWLHRLLAREPDARLAAKDLCAEIQRFKEFGEEPPELVSSTCTTTQTGTLHGAKEELPAKSSPNEATKSAFNPWNGPVVAPDASSQAAPWTGPPVMPDAPWQAFAEEPQAAQIAEEERVASEEKAREEAARQIEEERLAAERKAKEQPATTKAAEDKKSLPTTVPVHRIKTPADEAEEREVRKLFAEAEQRHAAESSKTQLEKAGAGVDTTSHAERKNGDIMVERQPEDQDRQPQRLRQAANEAVAPPAGNMRITEEAQIGKSSQAKSAEVPIADGPKSSTPYAGKVSVDAPRRRGFPCLCGQIRTRD